jgi:hypothetical protein
MTNLQSRGRLDLSLRFNALPRGARHRTGPRRGASRLLPHRGSLVRVHRSSSMADEHLALLAEGPVVVPRHGSDRSLAPGAWRQRKEIVVLGETGFGPAAVHQPRARRVMAGTPSNRAPAQRQRTHRRAAGVRLMAICSMSKTPTSHRGRIYPRPRIGPGIGDPGGRSESCRIVAQRRRPFGARRRKSHACYRKVAATPLILPSRHDIESCQADGSHRSAVHQRAAVIKTIDR